MGEGLIVAIALRLSRLERELTPLSGPRRCRVCEGGAKLGQLAVYADFPAWGERGRSCPACGREATDSTLVYGIDPEAL